MYFESALGAVLGVIIAGMAREIDPKRTRQALRRVRRLVEAAEAGTPEALDGELVGSEAEVGGADCGSATRPSGQRLSPWEQTFLTELDQRLETYGSAFHDASKGRLEEALSILQDAKLKEIAAKTRSADRAARRTLRRSERITTSNGAPGEDLAQSVSASPSTWRKPLRSKPKSGRGWPRRGPAPQSPSSEEEG